MKVWISKYFKNGKDRTVKVEVNDHDTFSLDYTLALIIYPALKKYKEDSLNIIIQAHPTCFKTVEEWMVVIDKMILAFELKLKDECDLNHQAPMKEGFELFGKYYECLWY